MNIIENIREMIADPIGTVLLLLAVVLSLTIHEFSHGFIAKKLGDSTAENAGRLTLNPISHIDPVGFFAMVFLGFGWAKPVPVNPIYFKNRKVGFALTALAGPVSNFLMALIAVPLLALVFRFVPNSHVQYFFSTFLVINISLGIFNLIPINPLDGSRILGLVLPDSAYYKMLANERYIQMGLFVILILGLLDGPLSAAVSFVAGGFYDLVFLLVRVL